MNLHYKYKARQGFIHLNEQLAKPIVIKKF